MNVLWIGIGCIQWLFVIANMDRYLLTYTFKFFMDVKFWWIDEASITFPRQYNFERRTKVRYKNSYWHYQFSNFAIFSSSIFPMCISVAIPMDMTLCNHLTCTRSTSPSQCWLFSPSFCMFQNLKHFREANLDTRGHNLWQDTCSCGCRHKIRGGKIRMFCFRSILSVPSNPMNGNNRDMLENKPWIWIEHIESHVTHIII